MFPLYLQYLLIEFRQTFVTGASWDRDDLITFLGQNIKVQGHTIAALCIRGLTTAHYKLRIYMYATVLAARPVPAAENSQHTNLRIHAAPTSS